MNTYISLSLLFLVILNLLGGCGSEQAKDIEDEKVIEHRPSVAYNIVKDEPVAESQQRIIHVSTFSYDEKRYIEITRAIKEDYKNENLDSIQLSIFYHDYNNENKVGEKIAEAHIAYTDEGAQQVGLENHESIHVKVFHGVKEERT